MNGLDPTSKFILALSQVEELSNRKKLAVIEAMGDNDDVGEVRHIVDKLLGSEKSEEFSRAIDGIDGLAEKLYKLDINYVTCLDADYPRLLNEIDDRPALLYAKGDMSALSKNTVGIVGSRKPTRYGLRVAEEFSRDLALADVTVISGFARGIDITAHRAAVEVGKPTVAVFGCGLDVCYPAEHKGHLQGILESGGLILSEYPLGAKPLQYHFPERNRIISGLSLGVLLAEAAKKSGSLITMRLALEQNREIFVVPGNIFSPECEGGNMLLRQMPHSLVLSADDILESLGISSAEKRPDDAVELSISESCVLEALRAGELHFEELIAATGLNTAELSGVLMSLTLSGLVDEIGSNYYALH